MLDQFSDGDPRLHPISQQISASWCAKQLELPLHGEDFDIRFVSKLGIAQPNTMQFVSNFSEGNLDSLNARGQVLLIANSGYETYLTGTYILSARPRVDFFRLLNLLFAPHKMSGIDSSAKVGSNCSIDATAYLGPNVVVGDCVTIGAGTQILANSVIGDRTVIGRNCLIKSGAVISQSGFGFIEGENGEPTPVAHLGSVRIGDYVEVGALSTVVAGVLDDTVLNDFVKLDDHVHVAHNVRVGSRTMITAHSEISGSVTIGESVWIGPNSSVRDGIEIADNTFLGIGAVLLKSTNPSSVIAGNPGREIRKTDAGESSS